MLFLGFSKKQNFGEPKFPEIVNGLLRNALGFTFLPFYR